MIELEKLIEFYENKENQTCNAVFDSERSMMGNLIGERVELFSEDRLPGYKREIKPYEFLPYFTDQKSEDPATIKIRDIKEAERTKGLKDGQSVNIIVFVGSREIIANSLETNDGFYIEVKGYENEIPVHYSIPYDQIQFAFLITQVDTENELDVSDLAN